MFLHDIIVRRDKWPTGAAASSHPFNIKALQGVERLPLRKRVTFFVGENGSGKSTLLEAIAFQCGFHTAGGGRNNAYELDASEAKLGDYLRLSWLPKITQGFFLRAESFCNFASHIDELAKEDPLIYSSYGGRSLHEQSHGESFLTLFKHRFGRKGIFYSFDERPVSTVAYEDTAHYQVTRRFLENRRAYLRELLDD